MQGPKNEHVPIVPTRNVVVYPGRTLPLSIGRKRSIAAVERANENGGWLLAVAQKHETENREPGADDIFRIGTLCKIEMSRGTRGEGYQIIARGVARVTLRDLREHGVNQEGQRLEALFEELDDVQDADERTLTALRKSMQELALSILRVVPGDTRQLEELVSGIEDLPLLVHLAAENIDAPIEKKQEILETPAIKRRALIMLELMQSQKDLLELQGEIREKLTRKMGKQQRENFLREQLRTIREELGEEGGEEKNDMRKKIDAAEMPEDVKKIALDEYKRLESMGPGSPEAHVIRTYLELLCVMPWNKSTPDEIDLDKARAVLEADHYGLDKIKKRIVQHLAVMKLKKEKKGSILLLVGPPGVGKTSLGQSVARALGRKFHRVSLGGVRDDAEIRGHRRTYIGAMPGRIVQGLKRAGTNNPELMLDEVDKLMRGYQGDPAGALLEVLDPEQNANFTDHYLDVAFDLSKVFFICTANTTDSIPAALLDRMEVIEINGYTTPEKLHIAKRHLVAKQLAEHGLQPEQVVFTDDALMRLATHYTREAGVRELQRHIAALCRSTPERVLQEGAELPVRIDVPFIEDVLGPEKYVKEIVDRLLPPGVVVGLAWTPVGGEILFIEATLMPGDGKLILTGQLGDIMKESAQIALSLVRSHLPTVVPGFLYEKKDLHIHVPAGATPKDGPSAGVTMLTAIASLFSGRRVTPKLAMTGEITLRGAVTPIGGVKEKVLAAHRAGVERILLPRRNEKDLRDVPEDVRAQLRIDFVETAEDVLRAALDLDVGQFHDLSAPQAPAPNSGAAPVQ